MKTSNKNYKAVFFWFSITLIGALVAFQIHKREHIGLSSIPVDPQKAPDFKLDGIALSDFKGKTVLLHFWATWCEPCRAEMPLLEALNQRKKENLVILAVAVDSSLTQVKSFFGATKPSFPVLLDQKHEVAGLYGISQFPETLLIGPDGMVRSLYIGPQDWTLF